MAVPAVVALLVAIASGWMPLRLATALTALGWWAAIAVPLAARQGWQWWPQDAWRQSLWPLLAWVLVAAATAPRVQTAGVTPDDERDGADSRLSVSGGFERSRWTAIGVLAVLTALIALPSGENWSDLNHLHRWWMAAVVASCLVNSCALESLSLRSAWRWSLLVALAGLAGPLLLAMGNYGSLAEWATAMAIATLALAAASMGGLAPQAWASGLVAVAAAAVVTANVRFYTFETYPSWVYAAALFLPAAVVAIDRLLPVPRTWLRVSVAAAVAAVAIAALGYRVLAA